jgi:26S proteasome regulatory subunit N2
LQNNPLVAYQLAFDLHENAPQQFLGQLKQELFSKNNDKDGPIAAFKRNLQSILDGEEAIKHHMQFLIKNNNTDMLILNQMKEAARGNCAHNATVIANGLMHTGTTCDDFLRFLAIFNI